MIISASRRTDIPAFYAPWFMERVRAGWCRVPNPVNPRQVSTVALSPDAVDAVVCWTRWAQPLIPHLPELQRRYAVLFLYTLVDYPVGLEPGALSLDRRIEAFRRVADILGPDRVTWRYDPIVLTPGTDASFHVDRFRRLAAALRGATSRCIVSFVDVYRKVRLRLEAAPGPATEIREPTQADLALMLPALCTAAGDNGMRLQSCAEQRDLAARGVLPGACLDAGWIEAATQRRVTHRKDSSQRPACRCVASRDIGVYDTCPRGCLYCYAVSDPAHARRNHRRHDPHAPALLPVSTDAA